MKTRRSITLISTALIALVAASSAQAAPNYVALGDSYTSGPFIPAEVDRACARSSSNYPRLAQSRIGLPLRDASCSGATTSQVKSSQFKSLAADTKVVSLTIGGNDIGFSQVARDCLAWNPFSSPCRKTYVKSGRDIISDKIKSTAAKVDSVLDGIRAKAPGARVFVVNYPALFPASGNGCWPLMPLARDDVPWLRARQLQLNAMLADQARANGAKLVDWYKDSVTHSPCASPSNRWVEPLVPGNLAYPLHPNRRGMDGAAKALVAAVGAKR